MTDKKKGVPTPKIKKLTKSQRELYVTLQKDTDARFRRMLTPIQEEMRAMAMILFEDRISRFADELETPLEDGWTFNEQKMYFEQLPEKEEK